MKLIMENFKKFVNEEELEGSSETDVIDDFLSAPVGEESSGLTEGQMELWFTLQNAEMIASLAVGAAAVGILGITGLKALGAKALKFLEDRQINAREAARAAREKAEEEQAEAELVLLTDFLLEDPTFVAALDGLVTSGSRKDVIAFNKSVRGKIKELGSMMNTSPAVLLKRLRKKAGAGDIEQRVVSDFEEKISSANPEQDAEALRKAEPASLPSRQRQKIKESIKGIKKMKLTKARLKQIIKEELSLLNEPSPSDLYNRLVHLRNEHQGEFALLDTLGEDGFKEVMRIRDEVLNSEGEGYDAYKVFFGRVKQLYNLFPNVVSNLWVTMPDIEALKVLKAEHDDLDNKFESRGATNTTDSMYGRKRTEVVHTGTGEVVSTGVDRKGSLGT